jgi:exopolysaccharide biosynthesis polyprenyl glycosylphosphotransferase
VIQSLVQGLDIIATVLIFRVAMGLPSLRTGPVATDAELLALLIPGLIACTAWPLLLEYFGLYGSQRRRTLLQMATSLLVAGSLSTATIAVATLLVAAPVTPIFSLFVGFSQCLILSSLRLVGHAMVRVARRHGRNSRNVLIVGTGPRARQVLNVMERHREWGLRVIGFLDESGEPWDERTPPERVHKLSDLPFLLREEVVDEVIVACPRSMLSSIGSVVGVSAAAGVPLTLLADVFGDYVPPPRITSFGSMPSLRFAPVHHGRSQLLIKRGMDIVGASLLLLAASPVLAAAALAIKLTSKGPVFFKQIRCGVRGRHFPMYKLRSMTVDAEAQKASLMDQNEMDGPVFKMKHDPRVTRVGGFLRRWSIDEIPQFWNVVLGDMSLVGPRPPVPMEVVEYATFQRRRLSMRPGITCLWQVSGRNDIGFEDWVRLDLEYIDTWSVFSDLKILLRTIPATLSGSGR